MPASVGLTTNPRTVRLTDLTAAERDVVLALVQAAKTAPATEAPDAVMPEVRDATATPTDE